ncbi:phosphatidate cytidylyltransferase [Flexibacterium corallicola]|uniref:phosphatidate cytidylyltransferase n=1 Tax=Flexibacterium corallicola TaxID=3037259 RepID=UPI00286FA6B3|nr:phosphatidate cytidylyltransferase [Pseudovibrio sp. M1P-2-3]
MSSEPTHMNKKTSPLARLLHANPDLLMRFGSAVILGPATLALTWAGGLYFAVLVAIGMVLLIREWVNIISMDKRKRSMSVAFVALATVGVLLYHTDTTLALAGAFAGALLLYLVCGLGQRARWMAEGFIYISLAGIALITLRQGTEGLYILIYLYFVVWGSDIAAYFCGRSFGGPKLWPAVSPNKTWSGSIGGVVFASIAGGGIAWAFNVQTLIFPVLMAAILAAASQLGDLYESALKRRFKVKDSSGLIPGHGGLLDRVDGLVFAAVLAMIMGAVVGGSISDPGLGLVYDKVIGF